MSDTLHDLKMPSFGADMTKGTLVKWSVKEGQKIERGCVIAKIETDKGIIDLDIFEDAIIEKLLLKEGDQVAVGAPIARLRSLSNVATPANDPAQLNTNLAKINDTKTNANVKTTIDAPPITATISNDPDFILATPAARAFANQHKLSLASVKILNKDKEIITLAMVEALHKETTPPSVSEPVTEKPIKQTSGHKGGIDKEAMRQSISDTVTRSKQQIPHYYLSQRLDISALERYIQQYNATVSPELRILLAAPLLCAIARTLMNNKQLNGVYENGSFLASSTVNLANAINLRGGGLVMPVIRDAQLLTTPLMMTQLREQVARAKDASLRISELSGGSFTVTNIGERGAEQMLAVIYPPQVAIIALGSAHQEVMVIEGGIQIRTIIEATLSADHRVSDGHIGARLLYQLNQQLQKPEDLWMINN